MDTTGRSPMAARVDARQALTSPFADDRWPAKLAIGALLALGPVVFVGIFFLIGYLVEITRRVMSGSDDLLPEWKGHFRTYFKQGFAVAWGVAIWLLPIQAVWLGAGLLLGGSVGLPIQIVFGVAMLLGVNLYAAVVMPSVIGRYATTTRFRSMFDIGEIAGSIRRIGTGFGGVLIVHLAVLALTFVSIWAVVTMVVTVAYAAMVFGHAYGQALRGPVRTEVPSA